MTYASPMSYSAMRTTTKQFLMKMSALNEYWVSQIDTNIGKNSDIDIKRIFIMYEYNSDYCENVILTYPG
jgi:hypothetical protein